MTIREEAFAGKALSCPIIDAHTHIGPYHLNGWHQKYDRTGTEQIVEDFTRLGINCIVTSPHPMVQTRMREANALAAEAARKFPGKIYGYITIVPICGMEEVKREIQKYRDDSSFIGLKFLTGYHGEIDQPEYLYALDFADEVGCPVLCHVWGDIPKRRGFADVLRTRHSMKLVIAHQGGGCAEDTHACAPIVQDHENAYMELCGSLYNQMPVEQITGLVGIEKVIFGTDGINLDAKYELGRVAFSPMNDTMKRKIFAENYLRMLETSQMGKIVL